MIDLLIEWLTGVFYDSFKFFGETEALGIAIDRQRVFSEFLKWEEGFNADKLAILDKGIKNSPFIIQVESYTERLTQKPGLARALRCCVRPWRLPLGEAQHGRGDF
jgi:hypothetical protein